MSKLCVTDSSWHMVSQYCVTSSGKMAIWQNVIRLHVNTLLCLATHTPMHTRTPMTNECSNCKNKQTFTFVRLTSETLPSYGYTDVCKERECVCACFCLSSAHTHTHSLSVSPSSPALCLFVIPFHASFRLLPSLIFLLSGTRGELQRCGWMNIKTSTTPLSPQRETSPTESKYHEVRAWQELDSIL